MSFYLRLSLLCLLPVALLVGCGGPDNEVTVSGVDDSALHSEADMNAMEADYSSQLKSE